MEIYLAGGLTANNQRIWKGVVEYRMQGLKYIDSIEKAMQVYLAAMSKRNEVIAGNHSVKNGSLCKSWTDLNILETFYYLRSNNQFPRLIKDMGNFLLDSGIFTFINSGVKVNMDDYIHRYADFVRENKIHDYVELDVDQLYGVKDTRKIRDKLESLVGWRSIPVWHTIRGKESFIQDCKDYDRICLGYCVNTIKNDLVKLMEPKYLEVIGIFNPRGGISIYPFANYVGDEKYKELATQRMAAVFRNE